MTVSGFVRVAALAVVTALIAPSAGRAQEVAPTERVPLSSDFENPAFADYFRDVAKGLGGVLREGALVVESDRPPGNCSLRTAVLVGDDTRANFVDVEVAPAPAPGGDYLMHGAGLVARYRSGNAPAFLAILLREGGYDIVAFADGDVPQRIGGSMDPAPTGPVRVAVRETPDGATFYVGGERVGSLSDSRVDGEAMGLVVCGPGRFVFDNWGQNTRDDIGLDPAPAQPVSDAGSRRPGPPPLPPAEWYVAHEGAPLGPITLPELRARLADGRSAAEALVWRDGMGDWLPASEALP
ncbi:DUF4339 domain-containing protein [Salinarimonas chemoclinalis]|uniref:DUF4339 domain-containing protein n=1 Tax=Salinarimonas chemoclinalis TaxID=3241599 RepID=UPI003558AB7F